MSATASEKIATEIIHAKECPCDTCEVQRRAPKLCGIKQVKTEKTVTTTETSVAITSELFDYIKNRESNRWQAKNGFVFKAGPAYCTEFRRGGKTSLLFMSEYQWRDKQVVIEKLAGVSGVNALIQESFPEFTEALKELAAEVRKAPAPAPKPVIFNGMDESDLF